jgi:adenylate cyclase
MEEASVAIQLVYRLVWPIVIVIALILFRRPLSEILLKITKVKLAAGKVKFDAIFQKYVSPEVLTELNKSGEEVNLSGERRRVTILCADTKGFTSPAEKLGVEAIGEILYRYNTVMTDIVFSHGGTVDNYSGHGLTAYWGAPISYEDSAERACNAALEMLKAVEKLNVTWDQEFHLQPLKIGIGITTGNVLVGNFGSEQRFNYTIMGDVVDFAFEVAGRTLHSQILITEETYPKVKDKFIVKALPQGIKFKGRADEIRLHEITGRANDINCV